MPRCILAFLIAAFAVATSAAPAEKPKLVVLIAVDQFRYDYLLRFRGDYKDGFDRLLTRGAVFTNARYEHFPTVTAIGYGPGIKKGRFDQTIASTISRPRWPPCWMWRSPAGRQAGCWTRCFLEVAQAKAVADSLRLDFVHSGRVS